MAIDKRLQVFDAEGNPVDYDILATDVKFNDGEDLPTKLGELEEEIGEGGYTPPQGGIPKTDLAPVVQTSLDKADTAYQKPQTGIPATDIADGVIPDVSGFATKTEVNTKANANDVYTKSQTDAAIQQAVDNLPTGSVESVTVNGTKHTPDTQGDVNLGNIAGVKGDDGITPHIGQNGHWWVGPETDSANDTGIIAQGPAGSSITDSDLVIAQTPSGEGDVLGMGGARIIKSNVDLLFSSLNRLYSKLANMAFWDAEDKTDAEPTPLDWSVPKVTVTITNNIGSGAVIKRNGVAVGNSLQVDQGDPLTLTIEAADGYELADIAATVNGVTATPTEADGVYTLAIANVNAAMAIAFNGTSDIAWLVAPKEDVLDGNGDVITYGIQQGRSINGSAGGDSGKAVSGITGSTPSVMLSPAGSPFSQKIFTSNPNPASQEPGSTTACYFATGGKRYLTIKVDGPTGHYYKIAVGCYKSGVIGNVYNTGYFVKRINYAADSETLSDTPYEWKFDIESEAPDTAYVKILIVAYDSTQYSSSIDTREVFADLSVKYKFTDD